MIRSLKLLVSLPSSIWLMFITYLPNEIGFILRRKYWKKRLKKLGKYVRIDTGVYFQNPGYISINDNSWIDKNVEILAGLDLSKREKIVLRNNMYKGKPGEVFIGKNCHIGIGCILSGISAGLYISDNCGMAANCKLYSFSHHYRSKVNPDKLVMVSSMVLESDQCLVEGPVYIGTNVGITLNCTILPGVTLSNNTGVHINSVVYRGRYPEGVIIGGNPAKRTGYRNKTFEMTANENK
jgi:acetyltransferase-like isoleucine patch superfamily enzyme